MGDPLGRLRLDRFVDRLEQARLAAREVVVERPAGQPGGLDDLLGADVVVAAGGEEVAARGDQRVARRLRRAVPAFDARGAARVDEDSYGMYVSLRLMTTEAWRWTHVRFRFRPELSAIGRRGRGRRSSSSTATWSTAGSGTGSPRRSPIASTSSSPTCPSAPTRWRWRPTRRSTPAGLATIVDDFIAALGLEDVTLVGNDSGGAVSQVLVSRRPARVARLVLTNCDTYENFPPGIFKAMPPVAKLPGGMWAMAQPFRIPAVSRRAFSAFTKSGAPRRPGRRLDRRRPLRPGADARPRQGHGRPRQALHARRRGRPARHPLPPAARLGARRQLLSNRRRRTPCRRCRRRETGARYPTRRPSYRSISPKRWPTHIADFAPSP